MRRIIGLLAGLVILMSISGFVSGALYTQYIFQEAFYTTWVRLVKPEFDWQKKNYPALKPAFDIAENLLSTPDPRDQFRSKPGISSTALPSEWRAVALGPKDNRGNTEPQEIAVGSAEDLISTIHNAQPGDVITIAPGEYTFTGKSIAVAADGLDTAPIKVRAKRFGTVTLQFDLQEGFHIRGANWIFENLIINGICRNDTRCEHAFHVVGAAHSTIIRNNWISNFNASLKVNGARGRFPDRGRVAYNVFINDRPRQTSNPVTLLDIVGASNWVAEANFIADFAKAQGDRVSYGAFFKGAGEDNIFERNLVRCEWRQQGGTRVGFSFGGGGTNAGSCRDGKCRQEHSRGIMRNNIVMNCPNDVGVYLNKSADTLIHNNLLIDTRGIDIRYPESTATVLSNVIDGRILARADGRFTKRGNIESMFKAVVNGSVSSTLFAEPKIGNLTITDEKALKTSGTPVTAAARDICGREYPSEHAQVGPFLIDDKARCFATTP
jgi:hypothetical protein